MCRAGEGGHALSQAVAPASHPVSVAGCWERVGLSGSSFRKLARPKRQDALLLGLRSFCEGLLCAER